MYREKLMELAEVGVARLSGIPLVPFIAVISVTGIVIGCMLIANPVGAIEFQKRFYEKINWRMEPISMPKEIRNTRLMGATMIGFLAVIVVFAYFADLLSE
jgi:hypothetical protein